MDKRVHRICIVEDDVCLVSIFKDIVSQMIDEAIFFTATSFEELERLMEKARPSEKFDLVIADIFLDGNLTGVDLWREYRERYPDTPILLTSAMALSDFFKALGPHEVSPPFLQKPFRAKECQRIIENLLSYQSERLPNAA